jgi:hypothetical protein
MIERFSKIEPEPELRGFARILCSLLVEQVIAG